MTIITKPNREKKSQGTDGPLIIPVSAPPPPPCDDVESNGDPSIIILGTRARRVSTTTTLCLLIVALMVVGMGIIGGTYLYKEYMRSHIFKGSFKIPYGQSQALYLLDQDMQKVPFNMTFNEDFEINTFEDYEKIEVPDFKEGRDGLFVHDFEINKTGIIDVDGHRCFIMPLNRDNVLPPKSLMDLINKMWNDYYKVDTRVVRETMRVVIPPITDRNELGLYISQECIGYPVYKLEKYVSGVWKRSTDLADGAKYAQFSGNKIVEFDIVNLHEVEQFEKDSNK